MNPRSRRPSMRLFLVAALVVVSLAGCTFLNIFSGVSFNKVIEGEITFKDRSNQDSNDLYFYFDWYKIQLRSSRTYSLELWTDPDVPIHFECDQLGEDLGAWDDGDGTWDGYLLYEFPEGLSSVGFDFYLRSDSVGSDSWYEFRINEE